MPGVKQKKELYLEVWADELAPGDILLTPCYDGVCDGPWHEAGVLDIELDATHVHARTLADSGPGPWKRRHEELVTVMYPRLPPGPRPLGLKAG